jgi:pyrroloquinoline quinone (PQQ) biosynthesis protein C
VSLAYFTVHAEADVRHREGERQALSRCLDRGASAEEVLDAASQALDAYWGLLDGVCRETGLATN